MEYKLYTDKKENFECDLFLEGADLKDTNAKSLFKRTRRRCLKKRSCITITEFQASITFQEWKI